VIMPAEASEVAGQPYCEPSYLLHALQGQLAEHFVQFGQARIKAVETSLPLLIRLALFDAEHGEVPGSIGLIGRIAESVAHVKACTCRHHLVRLRPRENRAEDTVMRVMLVKIDVRHAIVRYFLHKTTQIVPPS
jgi:hypothetical protein